MRPALLLALVGLCACNAPHPPQAPPARPAAPRRLPQPAVALTGTFADGTPLNLGALRGRPWVVNLWLPG